MRLIALLCVLFFSSVSFAQTSQGPDDIEIRARDVGRSLRCVVCQNQSIEDSDASLAVDMRRLVRDRLQAGDSDAEVIEFMRSRYGDYVLLKPPVQGNTYLLWFLPLFTVLGMAIWFIRFTRRKPVDTSPPKSLSEDEQEILTRLMDETK